MRDETAERALWQQSRGRLEAATTDQVLARTAHRLLWEVCQALGDRAAALAHLDQAIAAGPLFLDEGADPAASPRLSLLMLAAPGDFQANLPLDRLFDRSRVALHTLWLHDPVAILDDPRGATPPGLPPIDAVFVAVAEDAARVPHLLAADRLAAALGRPVLNNGRRIAGLSRAGVARLLRDLPGGLVPPHIQIEHGAASPLGFPLIVRPLGSHAGRGLVRIDDQPGLDACYAANEGVPRFTAAPFIDYRSADGLFRKYRVIFVAGEPFPLHLAIHDDWAVWYYNADMQGRPEREAEERRFLADIGAAFSAQNLATLRELSRRVGLDYFGLDCALMPDGRLLVFEVETGMIVHDRSAERPGWPHEDPCLRIRRATEALIRHRCALPSPITS